MTDTVVGAGISGIACAAALDSRGVAVTVRERGRRVGGRMASRTLRASGTPYDGRVADTGAAYFTASHPDFVAVVDSLVAAGTVRPWTDSFHVASSDGIHGVTAGPMRYAAPAGLRSVVEALVPAGARVRCADDVGDVTITSEGILVDGQKASSVALCCPAPQAERICADVPLSRTAWEPVVAVTCVFDERRWDFDGVFVNDDPVLTWIADDGRRRGDDAPVLVAHVNPVLAALHLQDPDGVVPAALASLRRILGLADLPAWVETKRWTYAKPLTGSDEPFWIADDAPLGLAGDAWSGGPRVEAAWLSGHRLGVALADRIATSV